jgi:glyoxylase-like metal-dependent hydrolase (beta-lactamase superfamily II)
MKPIQTEEVVSNIFAISNGHVNFYLVKTKRKYIAFDAGVSKKMALRELNKLNIKSDDVAAVFLTHTDSDHVGGIELFGHAKVYISKLEEQMIDGSTKRMVLMKNKLPCAYQTLNDSETVDIDGVSVKCIITPGHTKGSACYIVDNKYLFSGDNFSLKNGKARLFIALFNMDGNEQKKSIVKISGLQNIEAVFTGHHGYTNNFSEAFEDWRK